MAIVPAGYGTVYIYQNGKIHVTLFGKDLEWWKRHIEMHDIVTKTKTPPDTLGRALCYTTSGDDHAQGVAALVTLQNIDMFWFKNSLLEEAVC